VVIASHAGLRAHSDGDVLAHAIGDAILGALALGDLGKHFPDSDPKWRGVSSMVVLQTIRTLAAAANARIVNIDSTLIAESPRIAPFVEQMQANLAGALGIEPGRVSVKATTNEGLGAVGRGEGIAAMAVALVEVPR
jgi:2-C-methyl-D-erythritol 2,4-cyclodiphosphate synthase